MEASVEDAVQSLTTGPSILYLYIQIDKKTPLTSVDERLVAHLSYGIPRSTYADGGPIIPVRTRHDRSSTNLNGMFISQSMSAIRYRSRTEGPVL